MCGVTADQLDVVVNRVALVLSHVVGRELAALHGQREILDGIPVAQSRLDCLLALVVQRRFFVVHMFTPEPEYTPSLLGKRYLVIGMVIGMGMGGTG